MIKLGVCGDFDIACVARGGYDYVELPLHPLCGMEQSRLDDIGARLKQAGLRAECFYCFFPGDAIPLTGPNRDAGQIEAFAHKALERASALGGRIAVFGSGAARASQNGERDKALDDFEKTAALLGNVAAKYGMAIALEPLARDETDVVNTVMEGLAVCKAVNLPSVALLADVYHMYQNGEDPADLSKTEGRLVHVHVANPVERRYPRVGDGFDYSPYIEGLRAAGYAGRISIEAGTENRERDAREAMPVMEKIRAAIETEKGNRI